MATWAPIGGIESIRAEDFARFRAEPRLYHAAPDHPTFEHLRAQGLAIQPLPPGELPSDGLVIIPVESGLPARAAAMERVVAVVDRLLGPGGCPWDQEQTHQSLKRYLLEETYELYEAIDAEDREKMAEELGDVFLQPLMHTQISARDGGFDIADVANGLADKLIRRHPHVFGDASASTSEEVLKQWDQIKKAEGKEGPKSLLAGVPRSMPSLLRAYDISKRAVRVGFEWPSLDSVFEKLDEERAELHEAIESGSKEQIESELGDLLFTVVNVARWLGVEPEEALRKMLHRFTDRFMAMERLAPKPLQELSPEEWDQLWNHAKSAV